MLRSEQLEQLHQVCVSVGCPAGRSEIMAAHTTFQIGGRADLFVQPESREQIAAILRCCASWQEPPVVIGRGSNLLVADEGIRSAVLCLGNAFGRIRLLDATTIEAQAGADISRVCLFAQQHGLTGLEFAWGIPGSVGGAVYMNAGAYGGEIGDVLQTVGYLDAQGDYHSLAAQQAELSYRRSRFTDHADVITEAVFRLKPGDSAQIRRTMDETLAKRKEKQPLEYPSAGSTFKRPPGHYAAALIDQCGLKGRRIGGAMVSEKHAGFVINYDHATCADVLALIAVIQREVQEQTGVCLECEVKRI